MLTCYSLHWKKIRNNLDILFASDNVMTPFDFVSSVETCNCQLRSHA